MDERVRAVVDLIERERERFAGFARSLSEEELQRPVPLSGWIVRDFVSHLATIDRPIAAWFGTITGEAPAAAATTPAEQRDRAWDVDHFNDLRVAERRAQPLEAVLAEAAQERTALVEVIGRFSAAQLDATIRFGGDSKRPPRAVRLVDYL